MADQRKPNGRSRRRSGGSRNTLRRNHEIDHVIVQETFRLHEPREAIASSTPQQEAGVGDGCYVTAAVNNKRYYGVLVDQAALKAASLLYFQDEASGLDLNRRMKALLNDQRTDMEQQRGDAVKSDGADHDSQLDRKRPAVDDAATIRNKQIKTEDGYSRLPAVDGNSRQVQKFRYVEPGSNGKRTEQGYRLLLATFADVMAAADDDVELARKIEAACRSGGNFVGKYYYQYEIKCLALEARGHSPMDGMRMSMGFESFLQTASLPPWFPLSNLQGSQQKVLSLLNMKKDNNGNVVWDENGSGELSISAHSSIIPMKPRSRFRVCVVGGGISGLSCCTEIFRECDREGIPVEIVLLEGRNRLGGRLCTDRETFKCKDGVTPFPVDLGAQWIHGIELNPLASLAREAGAEFVTASESVKMFQKDMKEVDPEKDERAGKVFDKLLDLAAEDCWKSDSVKTPQNRKHTAVKWYASVLDDSSSVGGSGPVASEAMPHRQSTDTSVDCAIGRAIAKHKVSEFARLSDEERRMLMWNLKNVEYALGANISDLSMRFWDIDERHAFEGDHVMLRQGYSAVVDHMIKGLLKRGDSFDHKLNFPVGKLEYSRKTTTQPATIPVGPGRKRQLVELSDTCCVTSQDGAQTVECDFVVSCVPLGVLKEAIKEKPRDGSIRFHPPLPFSKRDAIGSVGFGLLDKVFLQFESAFWRKDSLLGEDQTIFGNASGVNPHLYMFFDVGKSLGSHSDRPAVLMSLISGREAVACEFLSESQLIKQTMETLRLLFSKISVPDPVAFRITRWGKDPFSRGSYTFLPPGTTDQDFHLLQSPINGNGDSLLLEGSETMRLFFAGEHTTALHPSMAHGALLSGVRAAKEVFSAMNFSFNNGESFERTIPMALYRYMNPKSPPVCSLCHRPGTTIREGTLLAFKKGSRQVLVHNNCAENSPEVEVYDGKWKDVLKAVSRSRSISCFLCGKDGASIGCADENCYRCYHFSCGEDTGWRFDDDGKLFYCDLHRGARSIDCVRISLDFYKLSRRDPGALKCILCGGPGDEKCGTLLAYQKGDKMAVVHENCARFTSIVDLAEDSSSRMEREYRNMFDAIERSRTCESCSRPGATVNCSEPSCSICFHFACALDSGWDFDKRPRFRCAKHRVEALSKSKAHAPASKPPESSIANGVFHHALFSLGTSPPNKDVPGNLDIVNTAHHQETRETVFIDSSDSEEEDQLELKEIDDQPQLKPELVTSEPPQPVPETMLSEPTTDVPTGEVLTSDYVSRSPTETHLARLFRNTVDDLWNAEFYVSPLKNDRNQALLSVALARPDPHDELRDGDVIIGINGMRIGSFDLNSLDKVLSRLGQEVEAMVEVRRTII